MSAQYQQSHIVTLLGPAREGIDCLYNFVNELDGGSMGASYVLNAPDVQRPTAHPRNYGSQLHRPCTRPPSRTGLAQSNQLRNENWGRCRPAGRLDQAIQFQSVPFAGPSVESGRR
jgi:hypothetical protein